MKYLKTIIMRKLTTERHGGSKRMKSVRKERLEEADRVRKCKYELSSETGRMRDTEKYENVPLIVISILVGN